VTFNLPDPKKGFAELLELPAEVSTRQNAYNAVLVTPLHQNHLALDDGVDDLEEGARSIDSSASSMNSPTYSPPAPSDKRFPMDSQLIMPFTVEARR